jgi:hypothetical protein
MTGDDGDNLGLPVAHTPERAEKKKIGATAAATEAAMADLAAELQPEAEPEQQSLLLDELDAQQSLFKGPVKHVASTLDAAFRARGRPKGSQNKASKEFAQTLMRMGFKHPGLNLAALANADPVELAKELSVEERDKNGVIWRVGCDPAKAMDMIIKANAELLPYFESKRPQPKDDGDSDRPLGVMYIGQMNVVQADDKRTIDITRVDSPDK